LQDKLIKIIERFGEQRIVILGDAIADKFLHGSISRVSREAPVFILRHQQTETLPGGAANCAMNLVALGARVSLISVTGRDECGSELRAKLEANPADHETRLALAGVYAGQRRYQEAMDELLEILKRAKNWREGEARKQLLSLFTLAASQPALVAEYRRKLASAMF